MNTTPKTTMPSKRSAAIDFLKRQAEKLGAKLTFGGSSRDIVNAHRNATRSDDGGNQSERKHVGSSRRLLPHECDQMAAAWERGVSVIEIKKFHGVSREAVYAQLRAMGYDTRRGAERRRLVSA